MKRLLKYLLELLIMFGLYVVCDGPGIKKYVIIAMLLVGCAVAGRKKKISADTFVCVFLPAAVYLLLGFFWTLINASAYAVTVKIVIFWLIPLLFAASLYSLYGEMMPHILDIQFIGSCLAYLIPKGRFIMETITVESMFSYAYGAFLTYYIYKKRWGFCVIAAVLIYLTDKRIVMLAVVIAALIQGITWVFRNDKRIAKSV